VFSAAEASWFEENLKLTGEPRRHESSERHEAICGLKDACAKKSLSFQED
jgi:hypothetical protein